jgi:mannose/fructose/N-acetylgalactosamine-specific phosphotransferase system component IID
MQNLAKGKTVLILFLITMAVYTVMLTITIPQVEQYANGFDLFDLSPLGYNLRYARALIYNLGDSGTDIYLHHQIPLDFIYPGLFAIAYSLFLTWLFAKSVPTTSPVFYLTFVPVLAGLFDYLENIGIIIMLTTSNITYTLVNISSTFTILKSGFTTLFFILLALGFIAWPLKKVINNKKNVLSTP